MLLLAGLSVSLFGALFAFTGQASAATYQVTNTNDSGAGSLRDAIDDANGNTGADTISFNIAGAGVHTITPESLLPAITDQVTIDGTTQTGASCGDLVNDSLNPGTPHNLLIELNGSGVAGNYPSDAVLRFVTGSDNSVVRGLVINGTLDPNFTFAYSGILVSDVFGMNINCNYIGSNAAGTADASSSRGIVAGQDPATNLTITNNLIVGGLDGGLIINGVLATNLTVTDNLIGIGSGGEAIVGGVGLQITTVESEGINIEHNVIANSMTGININVTDVDDRPQITNNRVADSNYDGIVTAGEFAIVDNIITGNEEGIDASGTNQDNSLIQGNTISVNRGAGIAAGSSLVIQENIITENDEDGIFVQNSNSLVIVGNRIGVDADGNTAGNAYNGIIFDTWTGFSAPSISNYTIGGDAEADRNIISANGFNGIQISQVAGDGCGTNSGGSIQGNYIGTNQDGQVEDGFGNGANGIQVNEWVAESCSFGSIYQIVIGGMGDGTANTIAGNEEDGVRIFQYEGGDVFSVSVLRNSIHSNGNLGINLAAADDPDDQFFANVAIGPNPQNDFSFTYPADNANNFLNAPQISKAEQSGDSLTLTYNFTANQVEASEDEHSMLPEDLVGYRLDFYANDAGQDGAYEGYSQGKRWIGSFVVNGSETNASHTFEGINGIDSSSVITATATLLWTTDASPTDYCFNGRPGDGPPYGCNGPI